MRGTVPIFSGVRTVVQAVVSWRRSGDGSKKGLGSDNRFGGNFLPRPDFHSSPGEVSLFRDVSFSTRLWRSYIHRYLLSHPSPSPSSVIPCSSFPVDTKSGRFRNSTLYWRFNLGMSISLFRTTLSKSRLLPSRIFGHKNKWRVSVNGAFKRLRFLNEQSFYWLYLEVSSLPLVIDSLLCHGRNTVLFLYIFLISCENTLNSAVT